MNNKERSLKTLQNCIDEFHNMTDEEIQNRLKEKGLDKSLDNKFSCNRCKMNSWCWKKDMDEDCPTAREILDYANL